MHLMASLKNRMIQTFLKFHIRQIFIYIKYLFIRMFSSARCPVAGENRHVMSAAEMPREEWLTNHTVPTCPAPRSPPPASAPVANGVPGSGLL